MDARMRKYRTTRWLGCFVAKLLLALFATTNPAQAAIESVAPLPDGGIWLFWDPNHVSPPTSSPDVACNSGYNSQWSPGNGYVYVGSVPNQYGYANLGYRDCKFIDSKTGMLVYGGGSIRREPFPPTCPIPTVNPTIPYTYRYANGMCEREAPCLAPNVINPATGQCEPPPEILTITLNGGTTTEPGDSLPLIATVTNQDKQPPKNPVTVNISLKVDATSGGHKHGTSARPRGGVAEKKSCDAYGDDTCWSSQTINGEVVFNFNPTDASGTHTITANCDGDGCSNTATKTVDVKIGDLWLISDSGYYALTEDGSTKVIGDNGNHSGNHYLTSTASMKLWRVAREYYEYQIQKGVTIPTVLHLNDASLKWGGKFDSKGKWTGYHYKHNRGNVIDIRANTATGHIREEYFADFETMAAGMGADAQLHCSETRDPSEDNCAGDENRHYHVILK